ncbi:hypothetical protein WDU94_005210 [Cyamophila willieti]
MINLCNTYVTKHVCRIFSKWYSPQKVERESSYFQRCWPPAWRIFIIVNCLYFTCFMFSLVWSLIKHSDSTRQPHCRILYSLQKIKHYHELFQSYWRDTLNSFFINLVANNTFLKNLINVINIPDDTTGDEVQNEKNTHVDFLEKLKHEKDDRFHSFIDTRNSVHKHEPRQHHNKHCLSSRRNVAPPSIKKTHQNNENKYDKRKFGFQNETEYIANFATVYNDSFQTESEEIQGHCPDCKQIRSRLFKQHSWKHKLGRKQPKTCRVIYHGPYASKKRNNINKYTIQCGDQNPRHSVCKHLTKERKTERNRVSFFSNEANCKSTIHSTPERTKKVKDQKKHTDQKENKYFSEEVLQRPPQNDSEELYGTPWTKIDPYAKNFMPNNSVKYYYKKPNRPNNELNQNLVDIVSNALKKVSKSIRHERQYCQRHYTW